MRKLSGSLALLVVILLSGCSTGTVPNPLAGPAVRGVQGVVHGGQQAVTGATLTLWAAASTGDGVGATSLASTSTGPGGSFTLTGAYTCPVSDPYVYITATGGNPGLALGTNNLAITMLAALTDCNTLKNNAGTTFIFLDEVTTVGAVAALSPYMTSTGNLSYGAGDAAAFATAFGNVAEYTNATTGTSPGPTLPGGFYASSTEINTLGNILASCINSTGGVAGDGSACGNLFNLTKAGSVAPTNTVGAMLNILANPTQNASGLFGLASAVTPFQPVDTVAPTSWVLPIEPMAATPTLSVAGGTYSSAQFVTLSDTTSGAVIHYTTDGTTPTSSSATYNGTAITVSSSETVNAVAQASGFGPSATATAAYTITGSTTTYSVGGQVLLDNACGSVTVPTFVVTLMHGSTLVRTTTTLGSGNFFFGNVPNGTYTVTPSISGPTSVVLPANQTVTVNGANATLGNFVVSLGYTVSGTVAYSGSQSGRTYISLNTSCGGGGSVGTSISSSGAYTIRGVLPNAYTLQAFMDNLGTGVPNAANPTGSSSVTVTSASLTNQNVTLADPGTIAITSAPTITGASGFNTGAVAQYKAITTNNLEQASSYTLQWSTSPTFATVTGSNTFKAIGTKADAWFFSGLTNGSIYYFRAYGSSAGTAVGPYSAIYGPVTIGAPTGGNAVTGSVTFSETPTGPLYVGFLSQTNGNFYAEYFGAPASAQAYTIQAPSDTYAFFAILDQNNNGLIDAGDIQDATDNGNGGNAATVISGPMSNVNLTLPSTIATATVTTQYYSSTISGLTNHNYNLDYQVNGQIKQPVAVTLASGPNVISPVDIAVCGGSGSSCGHGFQIFYGIGTTVPNVGDSYTFNVTYSDGTTGVVTATVSAVLNTLPTNLLPQTGTSVSTTPTFTWTDPVNASSYTYQFNLSGNNSDLWDIPGSNSNSNGFSSSITSIPWGTDPTGGGSTATVGSLTLGTIYTWQIQIQDSNGNSAATQVQYQP